MESPKRLYVLVIWLLAGICLFHSITCKGQTAVCEDRGVTYSEGSRYYVLNVSVSGRAVNATADVVFVVDESGSMAYEHQWIVTEAMRLDEDLKLQGIGAGGRPNLFALVGFSRNSLEGIGGIVLSDLASVENFSAAAQNLELTGIFEDGYSGIVHAVENIVTRSDSAKLMILVTDERRYVLDPSLTKTVVLQKLQDSGFILNVAVNQQFVRGRSFAFGLNENGTAYVFNSSFSSLFAVEEGGVPLLTGNVYEDYVELSYLAGGVAWDLNQLRLGGVLADAFSNAFTSVKVDEAASVFRTCYECLCTTPVPVCRVVNVSAELCFGNITDDFQCTLSNGDIISVGESEVFIDTSGSNPAADVIVIVDESGSMFMKHTWLPGMVVQLDNALKKVGIGQEPRNMFGVLGFGSDCYAPSEDYPLGHALTVSPNSSRLLLPSENISALTDQLSTGGQREDGYSAIKAALEAYTFRDVARLFILITDEDRDILQENLTKSVVEELLIDSSVILNAIVDEEFSGDNKLQALGIASDKAAYIFDPSAASLYRVMSSSGQSIPDSAYGSTNADYTQLALGLGGAAWDVGALSRNGAVTDAFTNAFVAAKVEEIMEQLYACMNCSCTSLGLVCETLDFDICIPVIEADPDNMLSVVVLPQFDSQFLGVASLEVGEDGSILCYANSSSGIAWTFRGGLLPANAVVSGNATFSNLTLLGAGEENTGVYSCFATTTGPNETYSAVGSLEVAVYDPDANAGLMLNPIESTAYETQINTTILCSANMSSKFNWVFEDKQLSTNIDQIDTTHSSLLVINDVTVENYGAYTCFANSTDDGVVIEDTAYLGLKEPSFLMVRATPQAQSVFENSSVQFTCAIDCLCVAGEFEWRKEGDGGGNELPATAQILLSDDRTTSTLLFENVNLEDDGLYTCLVTFMNYTNQASFELGVKELFQVKINVSESEALLEIGKNRFLVCESNQNTTQLYWLFEGNQVNGGAVPDNLFVVEVSLMRTVLFILQAAARNIGQYKCVGVGESGTVADDSIQATFGMVPTDEPSKSVILNPTLPPVVAPTPTSIALLPTVPTPSALVVTVDPQVLRLTAHQTGTFLCISSVPAPSTFEWKFNDSLDLPANTEVSRINSTALQLTILNTLRENTGQYQCVASNADGQESTGIALVVYVETISVEISPEGTQVLTEGDELMLSCKLECNNCSGALTWKRADGLALSSSAELTYLDHDELALTIPAAALSDDAVYVCAANHSGVLVATADVKVYVTDGVREVTISPGSLSVYEGMTAVFVCTSTAPVLGFVWSHQDVDGGLPPSAVATDFPDHRASQLLIPKGNSMNVGTYFCKVRYYDGTVSDVQFAFLSIIS